MKHFYSIFKDFTVICCVYYEDKDPKSSTKASSLFWLTASSMKSET